MDKTAIFFNSKKDIQSNANTSKIYHKVLNVISNNAWLGRLSKLEEKTETIVDIRKKSEKLTDSENKMISMESRMVMLEKKFSDMDYLEKTVAGLKKVIEDKNDDLAEKVKGIVLMLKLRLIRKMTSKKSLL